jgi:glycosyltransferase involved in cell wall biosynthesis
MSSDPFVIISCVFNAEKYISKCIESFLEQDSDAMQVVIDDCSSDCTFDIAEQYRSDSVKVLRNTKRVANPAYLQYYFTKKHISNKNTIVGILDGDDYLLPNAINKVKENIGDKWMFCSNNLSGKEMFCVKKRKTKSVIPDFNKNIRKQKWSFHHFRGWRKHLSDLVQPSAFYRKNKKQIRAASDIAFIYPMMEMSGKDRICYIDDFLYHYNIENPLNDHRVNFEEQWKTTDEVRTLDPYDKI